MEKGDQQIDPELLKRFRRAVAETYDTLAKMGFGDREGLDEHGVLGMVHRQLENQTTSQGFSHLWEMGRLRLSIEALVLRPEFRSLFSDEQRRIAQDRLAKKGYIDAS